VSRGLAGADGRQVVPPDSDQLELALDDVRVLIPWQGRNPRGLTKARMSLYLSQEAQKSMREFVDPEQGDLFKRPSPLYEGAVPLLPLPWEDYRG